MRDLVLLAGLAALLPLLLGNPFVGVIAWLWISLMNPQREVYGVLANFELNFYVAALTGFAWLLSRERKAPPLDGFVVLLALFALWTCVCTYAGLDRSFSMPLWSRAMKTMALVLAVGAMATSRARIQATLWVVVAAIGFYAVKGAGFVALTGGRHHVFGPADTMIADNNELGLALVALLPLLAYLRATSVHPLARLAALSTLLMAIVATLGTYSRGALVALVAMGVFHALRSRTGLVLLAVGALMVGVLPTVAPAGWLERMGSIRSYPEDSSFQGRVAAWRTSVNIALDRPLVGGGFSAVERDKIVKLYKSPGSLDYGKAAHSIFFQVLGDTGFVGLLLYLGALGSAGANTLQVLRLVRARTELAWAASLARALQTSFVAMLVGGAALSMAYYDGFLVILTVASCLLVAVKAEAAGAAVSTARRRPWARAPEEAAKAPSATPPGAPAPDAGRALVMSFENVASRTAS